MESRSFFFRGSNQETWMNLEDDELSRPIALAGALGLPSWVGFQATKQP